MYELHQVGEQSYYIDCPVKIGVYKQTETEVYLIDSGNDREAGKKILKIASGNGWKIRGIINTHSNADHIGGNHYLQEQTGCRIFARGVEAAFIRHPMLEPAFLYGGYPCMELRGKFLMASESDAVDFTHPDFPAELEVIPLPGHFFDMAGIRTPDDTVFWPTRSTAVPSWRNTVCLSYTTRHVIWKRWTGLKECGPECSCPHMRE